jgi:hypothetical protein
MASSTAAAAMPPSTFPILRTILRSGQTPQASTTPARSSDISMTSAASKTSRTASSYSNGTYTTLNDPSGTQGTWATGINDAGQIVGYCTDSSGATHGFLVHSTLDGFAPAAKPRCWRQSATQLRPCSRCSWTSLDPLIFGMQNGTAAAHFLAGRYGEASSWAEKTLGVA